MASIVQILNSWSDRSCIVMGNKQTRGSFLRSQSLLGRMILNKVGRHKARLRSTDLRLNTHV
jgi:hypothetical protein